MVESEREEDAGLVEREEHPCPVGGVFKSSGWDGDAVKRGNKRVSVICSCCVIPRGNGTVDRRVSSFVFVCCTENDSSSQLVN